MTTAEKIKAIEDLLNIRDYYINLTDKDFNGFYDKVIFHIDSIVLRYLEEIEYGK